METLDALYAAVVQAPEDEAVRLRLADALDQQGDPRGEFIRVQVQLSHLPEDDEARYELRRREMDLLLQHGSDWAGARWRRRSADYILPSFGPRFGEDDTWTFRRGFLETGALDVRTFLVRAEEIFAELPVLSLLVHGFYRRSELSYPSTWHDEFYGNGDLVEPFASCPHVARLRELELNCHLIGDPGANTLVSSPHLANLRSLRLYLGTQTGCVAEALATNAQLSRLEELEVGYNDDQGHSGEFGDDGLRALVASSCFEGLRRLVLERGRIGAGGIRALAGSPLLDSLEELSTHGNPIGLEGVKALARSPGIAHLRKLDLYGSAGVDEEDEEFPGSTLGVEGVRALAPSPYLTGLTELMLSWNEMGDKGAGALSRATSLHGLRRLDISMNEMGEKGATAIAGSPNLTSLVDLDIGYNDISDSGVRALVDSPSMAGLRKLSLAWTEVTDESMYALAKSPHLTQLRTLNLSSNRITAAGLRAILFSPNAAHLRRLILGGHTEHDPDDGMVAAIAESPYLARLYELDLGFPRIAEASAQMLASSPYLQSLALLKAVVHSNRRVVRVLRKRWGERVDIGEYEP